MAEYRIDPASGTLTVVNPALITQNLATFSFRDPGHNFLYVIGSPKTPNPDFSTLVISGYTVDQNTGAVTPTPGSPYGFNQQELSFATVRPDHKFAYIDDAMSATILHIVAMDPGSGALLQEAGTITIAGSQNASNLAHGTFDSSGHFLYVINAENNNVAGYSSDPVTGMLTPIPGSPFSPHGAVPTGCSPKANFCGGTLAVSGNHLYYASELFPGIAEFNIDPASGILTEAPRSPFPAAQPGFTAITTPSGKFLYVTAPSDFGPGNLILGYAIDPVTGALTAVPGSPYSTTGNDLFADMDESGQFLYVTSDGSIVGYRIDQGTGALTLTPGSPFPATGITGLTVVH
jgi:6-phosphogluconolactonase (cycloisomerase 2 family)